MKLDISALLGGGEERLPFSCRLDAAGLTDDIVCGTAEFSGVFENHSGYLSITAKASLSLTVRCARCGKAFPLSETYALDCPVRVEGAGEDDGESVLVPADGQVDLRETAESFLLLSLPRGLPRPLPRMRARSERGDMHLRRRPSRSAAGKAAAAAGRKGRNITFI